MWVGMAAGWTAPHLLISWYRGREARPLLLVGVLLWISSIMAMGAHRRWKAAHQRESPQTPWRFSTAELLLMFTGAIAFLGFMGADYRQSLHVQREQSRLREVAAPLLGPDGRLDFDAAGRVSIVVCDRSFCDARLTQLAALIAEQDQAATVTSLMFGSSANTSVSPPRWPGVTDRSVDLILQWDQLEWLFIEGTDLTHAARQRLSALPRLHETSQRMLRQE
jgi:hypothetical protein